MSRYAIPAAATRWLAAAAVAAFFAGAGVQLLRGSAPVADASAGERVAAIASDSTPPPAAGAPTRAPALNTVGIPALRMPVHKPRRKHKAAPVARLVAATPAPRPAPTPVAVAPAPVVVAPPPARAAAPPPAPTRGPSFDSTG